MPDRDELAQHGRRSSNSNWRGAALVLALVLPLLTGCATQELRRGHLFASSDLQQIQPGMTQDQVRGILGTPDTSSTVGNQAFYYISSTAKGTAFLEPTEVDRQVLVVYFNPVGTVDQLANYTLKDGKVIDTINRETPSARGDKGLIEKLFKGVGKKQQLFDPQKG
jgi:outer membrane protein assembly factor BamE (lipoprotein component of BamABCDE complex)